MKTEPIESKAMLELPDNDELKASIDEDKSLN